MKVKKVSYELVEQESPAGKRIYPLVARLVEAHHEHLANARIAIAWCTSWNPDVDGRVTLGKCKRASDLDRELMPLDFVILLARWFYESGDVTDAQREALLDHELCHAEVVMDRDEPKLDERGRIVYRTRKHDIEEFAEIVLRHGTYKRDLEAFADALRRSHAADGDWVGYSRLQQGLSAAGLVVPIERIVHWTASQRQEAQRWLTLKLELAQRPLVSGGTVEAIPPDFVAAAAAPVLENVSK